MYMAPLSNDRIAALAPSVFATEPHFSRSDRYAFVPTVRVLDAMRREGFEVVQASQSRTRDVSKREFTKHMLRLRHTSKIGGFDKGEVIPEIVLRNAHDGSSAYDLMAGIFRMVCSNGMVVADSLIESVKVRHTGDVVKEIIDASFRVLEQTGKAVTVVDNWRSISLSRDEQVEFAKAAHIVRFANAAGEIDTPIQPDQLLKTRRIEDRTNDLWTTLNVLQENVIRGGISAVRRDGGKRRKVGMREVNGIDQNVRLNTALWSLAEGMQRLKQAA